MFQPIVLLDRGQIVAYEALSRPKDGGGRPLAILDVVECARAAGAQAEAELDQLAIAAIVEKAQDLPRGAMLFVNVSPATLLDYVESVQPLAVLSGRVVLEITERSAIPDSRMQEFLVVMDRLRWLGFLVAMDDCGAGYSGLTRLVTVKPDFAKVDIELVRGVDHDSAKAQLVEALVSFARRAGISVIAEGVETEAELDTLGELGVGRVQGDLLARPTPHFLPVESSLIRPKEAPVAAADAAAALGASTRLARMAARGLGDAPGLYEAIVHAAHEATGADITILRRRDAQVLVSVATSGVPYNPRSIPLSSMDRLGQAFNASRVVVRQTRAEGSSGSPYGSACGVPVLVDGAGWGMLTVGFHAENRIRGELVDLTTNLADLSGLILAANRGGLQLNRTDMIDALRYTVAHPGDLSDFLGRIVRDIERVTGSHDCWVGTVQEGRLDIVTGSGEVTPTPLTDWLDAASETGSMPPGVALREARCVIVDDIRKESSLASQLEELLAQAIISAAAIPMPYEGRVVGILKVYHSTVAAFTEEQLSFLEEVALLLGKFLGPRAEPQRA